MLDGRPLVDVHLHPARLPGLKLPWDVWVQNFGTPELAAIYAESGTIKPAAFDAYLEAEGVDIAVVLAEYSPRVTGMQTVEDMLPLAQHNPARIKFEVRLTRRMIFATDWPGVPGIAKNARAVAALCPDDETADVVLAGNAAQVYNLKLGS